MNREEYWVKEIARLDEEYKAGTRLEDLEKTQSEPVASKKPAMVRRRSLNRDQTAPASTIDEDFTKLMQKLKANKALRSSTFSGEQAPFYPKKGSPKTLQNRCPICNESLPGDLEEVNLHIDHCLDSSTNSPTPRSRRTDTKRALNEELVEYYRVGNQTRIRTCSVLVGGYGNLGFQTSRKSKNEDESVDLDVDADDEHNFGPSQYSENDLLNVAPAQSDERSSATNADSHRETGKVKANGQNQDALLISALKEKIREQAAQIKSEHKCLICLEPYTKPVVSVICWHVHCEQCWLRTLGAKKLCPQCTVITSPGDLRRVYL